MVTLPRFLVTGTSAVLLITVAGALAAWIIQNHTYNNSVEKAVAVVMLISGLAGIVLLIAWFRQLDAKYAEEAAKGVVPSSATDVQQDQAVGWFIKREVMGSDLPPEGVMMPLIHIREPEGVAKLSGDAFWHARLQIVPNEFRFGDGWLLGWKGVYELPRHEHIAPKEMLWLDHEGNIWIARNQDDPLKEKVASMQECRLLE